jgi:hypothetical protein
MNDDFLDNDYMHDWEDAADDGESWKPNPAREGCKTLSK